MNEATQSSALDGAHVVVFGGSSGIGLGGPAAAGVSGFEVLGAPAAAGVSGH